MGSQEGYRDSRHIYGLGRVLEPIYCLDLVYRDQDSFKAAPAV